MVMLQNLLEGPEPVTLKIKRKDQEAKEKYLLEEIRREARDLYFYQYHDRAYKNCLDNLELRFIVSNKVAWRFFDFKQRDKAFRKYFKKCLRKEFFDKCFEALRLFKVKRENLPKNFIRDLYRATKGRDLQVNFMLTNHYREFFSERERIESFEAFYEFLNIQSPSLAGILKREILVRSLPWGTKDEVIESFNSFVESNEEILPQILTKEFTQIQL